MRSLRPLALAVVCLGAAGCSCSTPPVVEDRDAGPGCVANVACTTNPGAPCHTGHTSCTTGTSTCVDSAAAAAGTACGAGLVCDGTGACVACVTGAACGTNPGAPCHEGVLSCAGGPTCTDGALLDAGAACGAGQVCSPSGACIACVSGAGCSTNAGAPCRAGVTSCAGGVVACTDGTALDAGVSCGAGHVCDGAGACAVCSAGASCTTNPGGACVGGIVACGTGAPVCKDTTALSAGTSCGSNLVCAGDGGCVACAGGSSCSTNPGGACVTGAIACSTGAPVCRDSAPTAAGLSCGANQVCAGDGGCVSCTADAGCAPSANPCEAGAIACGSGAPVCVSRGSKADGVACGGAGSCLRGACTADVTVSATVNLSQAALDGGTACGDMAAWSVTGLTATTATLATAPGNCLRAGDEVLLINEQGTPGNTDNVGAFELFSVASVSATTVTFTSAKQRGYGADAGSDLGVGVSAGQQRVALVRVPHYGALTVASGATLTVDAWNGFTGGVLALRAASLTVDGTITARARGYRDGRYSSDGPCNSNVTTEQGESYTGPSTQSTSPNGGGSGGIGAASGINFNNSTPMAASAGHASVGQPGTNGNGRTLGGPGVVYGSPDGGLLTMGSGVAGNLTCNGSGAGPSLQGTVGPNTAGGVVVLFADALTVSGTGRVTADAAPSGRDGAPSGGSVYLRGRTLTLGTNRVTAQGATAIAGSPPTVGLENRGSDGYVFIYAVNPVTGTTAPAARVELVPSP